MLSNIQRKISQSLSTVATATGKQHTLSKSSSSTATTTGKKFAHPQQVVAEGVTNIANHFGNVSRAQQFRNYAFTHPFRAYVKVGSITFGGVFLTNCAAGVLMSSPPVSPFEYPQGFAQC